VQRAGVHVDESMGHLGAVTLPSGDVVLGNLPVHLAARVCESGARYLQLVVPHTVASRGLALTAEGLVQLGAHLVEFRVMRIDADVSPSAADCDYSKTEYTNSPA